MQMNQFIGLYSSKRNDQSRIDLFDGEGRRVREGDFCLTEGRVETRRHRMKLWNDAFNNSLRRRIGRLFSSALCVDRHAVE